MKLFRNEGVRKQMNTKPGSVRLSEAADALARKGRQTTENRDMRISEQENGDNQMEIKRNHR